MATIKQFEKGNLGGLRIEIQNALNEIAKKNGLSELRLGSIDPVFLEQQKRACAIYGLPSDTLGRQFTSNGMSFQVTRVDTKKPKFPVIAKSLSDGKSYKFTVPSTKANFAKQGA